METIKKILSPGKDKDDETLYGQNTANPTNSSANTNTSSHHSKGLTGEGSHFGQSKDTSGLTSQQNPGIAHTQGTSTTTTSGPHSSDIANKADPRVDSDNSKFAGSSGAYASSRNEGLGTGEGAGLGHRNPQQYGTGNSSSVSDTYGTGSQPSTVEPHRSNLANRADPRVDSDNSKATGQGLTGGAGGYSSTSGGSYHTGPSGSAVSGPHETATANRLDPSVNRQQVPIEDAHEHSEKHGGGAEKADHSHGLGAAGATWLAAQGSHTGHDRGAGTTSTAGGSTTHSGQASDPNFGRDGTIGGGGVSHASQQYPDQSTSRGLTGGVGNTSSVGQSQSGYGNTTSSDNHNYGRDAALGAGGAGAAGLALHQHNKNQTGDQSFLDTSNTTRAGNLGNTSNVTGANNSSNLSSSTYDQGTPSMPGAFPESSGPAPNTAGPHKSDMLNKLDPRVTANPDSSAKGSEHTSASGTHSGQSGLQSDTSKDHNYGRNAALAGGAAGIGGATYIAQRGDNNTSSSTTAPHDSHLANRADPRVNTDRSQDHSTVGGAGYDSTRQTQPHGVSTTTTTHTSTTTSGPHSSNLANKADPTVDSDRSKDHNYGRDAGLAGAGVGAGAYGASKLHSDKTTAGPHDSNAANRADPTVDSDRSKDSHHGRDAALVGGAGAGAYGAHKYNERDEHDLKKAEKEAEKDRKHAEKEAEKDRKHAEKESEKDRKHAEKEAEKHQEKHDKNEKKEHKGLFSFLHRDKNKKYTKEEEDEFDRQEREHESNTKRNAALAGGAGAAATGGAYVAHQKHSGADTSDTNKPLPAAPGISTTANQQTTGSTIDNRGSTHGIGSDNTSSTTHGQHQHGSEHHGPTPEAEKPLGTTIGDKLHGVDRNRGVPGPTGFPDEQARKASHSAQGGIAGGDSSTTNREHEGTTTGLGLGAGTGAGALGSNDHRKAQIETAASGNQHQSSTGGITGTGHHQSSNTNTQGSGLTGSHHQNTSTGQYDSSNPTSPRDAHYVPSSSTTSGVTTGNTHGHHDTSTTTPRQYDSSTQSQQRRGLGEHDTTQGGAAYGQGEKDTGLGGGSGRNRLHKDPPAGHPSATSNTDNLDGNTGVANSHSGERNL